jgi:nucleoside phosphorylase
MPSQAYLGRIGGLAAALSVGAAIVTEWSGGPAWADDSPGSAGSTTASSPSGTEPATAKPTAVQGTTESGDTGTTTTTATNGPVTKDNAVRSAPAGVVVGTGGFTQDAAASTERSPSAKGSDGAAPKPSRTKVPVPMSTVSDAKHDATAPARAGTNETTDAVSRPASLAADPTSTAAPTVAPTQPEPTPPNAMNVVAGLVSGVVNAILSPFTARNTQGAPADAPSLWTLLAFARREFERALQSPSLADTPVSVQTTSQTLVTPSVVEPEQRTLILTAFPAEADAILARTTLDPNPSVVVDGHHFYLGSIGGKKVIVAMTGIGMVNATNTTETALGHFTPESGISIGAVVFSGVAGGSGRTQIGSVAVPARWTSDDGTTWHAVDPGMLAAANTLDVDLLSTDTIGDPACIYCGPLGWLPLINLNREPELFVGGDGSSDDDNNGAAFPSIPSIPLVGDIFGAQPFAAPDFSLLFTGNFFQALVPFLANGLLSNLTGLLTDVPPAVDAVDQETAAAQQVADAHGIPFLGIRGMSDGPGDPLNLPGYPFTFVVYKQIAADNAAIVTEAFLNSWAGA